jgi:hypothetical protein
MQNWISSLENSFNVLNRLPSALAHHSSRVTTISNPWANQNRFKSIDSKRHRIGICISIVTLKWPDSCLQLKTLPQGPRLGLRNLDPTAEIRFFPKDAPLVPHHFSSERRSSKYSIIRGSIGWCSIHVFLILSICP